MCPKKTILKLSQMIVTFFTDAKSCITNRSNSSAQSRFVRCSRTDTRRQFKKFKVQSVTCDNKYFELCTLNSIQYFLRC